MTLGLSGSIQCAKLSNIESLSMSSDDELSCVLEFSVSLTLLAIVWGYVKFRGELDWTIQGRVPLVYIAPVLTLLGHAWLIH